MKQFIQQLFLFCLPLLLTACEEGLFGEPVDVALNCIEIQEEINTGLTIERVYDDSRITELRFLHHGNLVSYYAFTYNSEDRIHESQFFDVANNLEKAPQQIRYNDEGKWV